MIPIVLLHKDEPVFLQMMIESIINNTNYAYKLYVVDNCSNLESSLVYLEKLKTFENITLIMNKSNSWVFGFNEVFKDPSWDHNWKYTVFSDCDILVPAPLEGICWLTHLVNEMNLNCSIGKLGLSLSVKDINQLAPFYSNVIAQEKFFDEGLPIGSNKVAPVDTTLAIYRRDLFVFEKFRFTIGHASLVRPYYYTCRASRSYEAVHLGWHKKSSDFSSDLNVQLKEKIRCFAKYAAYIEPSLLKRCSLYERCYFNTIKVFCKTYWSLLVLISISSYIFNSFPLKMNRIQESSKFKN